MVGPHMGRPSRCPKTDGTGSTADLIADREQGRSIGEATPLAGAPAPRGRRDVRRLGEQLLAPARQAVLPLWRRSLRPAQMTGGRSGSGQGTAMVPARRTQNSASPSGRLMKLKAMEGSCGCSCVRISGIESA